MGRENDTMDQALEVFAQGVCFTRSFTHAYLADRIGKLWVLRDAPRKTGDYRKEEWVAYGIAPQKVDPMARKHTRGHFMVCAVCAVDESDEPIRAAYKELGYRLGSTERVMAHDLKQIPNFDTPARIARVTTVEMVERVNQLAGARQILPGHLEKDSPLREYVAIVEGQPAGWVRSIDVGRATWCADLHVQETFRRRGIGSALIASMLRDDRARGSKVSVLTANQAGAGLYASVGYKELGTMLAYTLKK
jgi:hypothetical protein